MFLIERIAPGHARFRLAGNMFHDLIGMDVRGIVPDPKLGIRSDNDWLVYNMEAAGNALKVGVDNVPERAERIRKEVEAHGGPAHHGGEHGAAGARGR